MARTATMKIWDVELGLAVHIKAPNGKYIVIDLGSKSGVSPLKSLRWENVGYMVITHPHFDHFSDIENISYASPDVLWRCKAFTREELLSEAKQWNKDKVTQYCDFVERYNGTLTNEKDPSTETPFGGLTATVFQTSLCNKSNKNNFSAIVVLQLGNAKVVVCGDNEKESFEHLMLKSDFKETIQDSWVLVAPHHGRESGFYKEFVELVNPDITIVSDASQVDTTASSRYSSYSKGYNVYNALTGESKKRYCLTTRTDGNIEVIFGESDNAQYIGTLRIESKHSN